MKFCFLFVMLLLFTRSFAQTNEPECGLIPDMPAHDETILSQQGGLYITAQGDLKVLLVFVQFPDDNSAHPYWPSGQAPNNMDLYIDPDMTTNSSHYANLTHYFKDMSMGIYHVTGEAVYVNTPHTRQWYETNGHFNRYYITKDVLQNAVDPLPNINFADYDNWTRTSSYNNINAPDGAVDMIVMVWRGLIFANWLGEASLGGGNNYPVENGTKSIKSGSFPEASGVTIHFWGERDENRNFRTFVHEISHYLLGGSHPYGSANYKHGIWSMFSNGFKDGVCANTYERERLAWINPTSIDEEILNAPFLDYVENGIAYKYHPSNGYPNEYYYFENHQKSNTVYDDATVNSSDKGIFIIHQRDIYNETNNIRCKVADGQWDWENPYWVTRPGDGAYIPAFRKLNVNPNGRNHRDQLQNSNGINDWLWAFISSGTNVIFGSFERGYYFNDAFNEANTVVFSPYSNPNSNTWSGNSTPFAMEIFSEDPPQVNVHFYINNPEDAPPAKPQDLKMAVQNNHPYLTWYANSEPDLNHYEVWKIDHDLGDFWYVLGTTSNDYYLDTYAAFIPRSRTKCHIEYKLKAVDNTNLKSIFSDIVTTIANSDIGPINKPVVGTDEIITQFYLYQNYPNPFNPITHIQFDLPHASLISLVVYDVQGSVVEQLINNEMFSEGHYQVPFDASSISSGVYIYKLIAEELISSKRMLLIK